MKVIVESGATKSDWRVIDEHGQQHSCFIAEGTNVSTMPMATIRRIISESCQRIKAQFPQVHEVFLYTAGVLTDEIVAELQAGVHEVFEGASCDVQTDLIGAARAACGHGAGIAAILGTGSNSCLFDGENIVKRVYSSGFILGDEGSAATLGKLFVSDFLKGLVPAEIAERFAAEYKVDYATVVENVYRNAGSPSGYLGSFAPFILKYYGDPYITRLVDDNFRAFIRRSIKQYDYERYSVGVVGGFGHALKDIFSKIAQEEGIRISCFYPAPIEGLIKYHTDSHTI